MDDDLLFCLSGLMPGKSSLKTAEESCASLNRGLGEKNSTWPELFKWDRKQRNLVLSGVVYLLEQEKTSKSGVGHALETLYRLRGSWEGFNLFETPEEIGYARRLVLAITKELFVGPKPHRMARLDNMEGGEGWRTCDGAAFVLNQVLLEPNLQVGAFQTDQMVREEIARLGMAHFVVQYCQNVLNPKVKTVTTTTTTSAANVLRLTALSLIERLSVSCRENALFFAQRLPPSLLVTSISKETDYTAQKTALRALINMTNGMAESARLCVESGAMETVVNCLKTYLPADVVQHAQSGTTLSVVEDSEDLATCLKPFEFDGILICLTTIGNLVEFSESGGTLRFTKIPAALNLLTSLFRRSLPVRARTQLEQTAAGETVETEWTPESLVLAAYTSLVIGCIVRDSREASEFVRTNIPGGSARGFLPLVQVLQTFLQFQQDAGILTEETEKVVRQVAEHLNQANNRSMLPPSSLVPPNQLAKKRRQTANATTTTTNATTVTGTSQDAAALDSATAAAAGPKATQQQQQQQRGGGRRRG